MTSQFQPLDIFWCAVVGRDEEVVDAILERVADLFESKYGGPEVRHSIREVDKMQPTDRRIDAKIVRMLVFVTSPDTALLPPLLKFAEVFSIEEDDWTAGALIDANAALQTLSHLMKAFSSRVHSPADVSALAAAATAALGMSMMEPNANTNTNANSIVDG